MESNTEKSNKNEIVFNKDKSNNSKNDLQTPKNLSSTLKSREEKEEIIMIEKEFCLKMFYKEITENGDHKKVVDMYILSLKRGREEMEEEENVKKIKK